MLQTRDSRTKTTQVGMKQLRHSLIATSHDEFSHYVGSDITTLEEICKVRRVYLFFLLAECQKNLLQKLDCALSFFNTADFRWGAVAEGSVSGSYKEIVDDQVDIVGGCRILTLPRVQVRLSFLSRTRKTSGLLFFVKLGV